MRLFLCSLLLLGVGSTYAGERESGAKENSSEIPEFVEARIASPISMTIDDLPKHSWQEWRDRFSNEGSELSLVYTHEPPEGMSDGFTYKVFVEIEEQEYWIIRYGGITGASEVFGPGDTTEPILEKGSQCARTNAAGFSR